ncbi:Os03g0766050 [Oryza sativa Japonica Group]|uniref:Os03g0766050 protein n=1 Tax=Oryza sativa subsp. japonica TaxID=39947 RepID=A0A0P0W418_ORYSJ|nr:Os03g0766050 [Oryza sativa Japonica Group]
MPKVCIMYSLQGFMVPIASVDGKYGIVVVIAVAALAERASKAKTTKILYDAIVDSVWEMLNKITRWCKCRRLYVEGDEITIALGDYL